MLQYIIWNVTVECNLTDWWLDVIVSYIDLYRDLKSTSVIVYLYVTKGEELVYNMFGFFEFSDVSQSIHKDGFWKSLM